MPKSIQVTWHVATTAGQRAENQDRVCATPTEAHAWQVADIVMLVCDGVGGEHGGGRAAEVAAAAAYAAYQQNALQSPRERLRIAIDAASRYVHDEARRTGFASMSSTIVMAALQRQVLHVAHVGDSRAYLWRRGRIERLTRDHVRYVKDGSHKRVALLTRALGNLAPQQPDVCSRALQPGDRVLLCSDGLHRVADDKALASLLGQFATPEQATQDLIRYAVEQRSTDNISAAVMFIGEHYRQHAWPAFRSAIASVAGAAALLLTGFGAGWWAGAAPQSQRAVASTTTSTLQAALPFNTPTPSPIMATPTLAPTETVRPTARPKPRPSSTALAPTPEADIPLAEMEQVTTSPTDTSTPTDLPTATATATATEMATVTPGPSLAATDIATAEATPTPTDTPTSEEQP